jgi:hypothetical protein
LIYFGLASLWGFSIGTASILIGLNLMETPLRPNPMLTTAIAAAAVLALVGGIIAAIAYREAARRISR